MGGLSGCAANSLNGKLADPKPGCLIRLLSPVLLHKLKVLMETEFSVDCRVENDYEVHSPPKARSGQSCSDVPTSFKLPLAASTRCMTIIPELRWKIFQLVHDGPADSMGNRTLLALALTCKSFSGPALDLLWQDLDNFLPLVECLPQGLWKWTGHNMVSQAFAHIVIPIHSIC